MHLLAEAEVVVQTVVASRDQLARDIIHAANIRDGIAGPAGGGENREPIPCADDEHRWSAEDRELTPEMWKAVDPACMNCGWRSSEIDAAQSGEEPGGRS